MAAVPHGNSFEALAPYWVEQDYTEGNREQRQSTALQVIAVIQGFIARRGTAQYLNDLEQLAHFNPDWAEGGRAKDYVLAYQIALTPLKYGFKVYGDHTETVIKALNESSLARTRDYLNTHKLTGIYVDEDVTSELFEQWIEHDFNRPQMRTRITNGETLDIFSRKSDQLQAASNRSAYLLKRLNAYPSREVTVPKIADDNSVVGYRQAAVLPFNQNRRSIENEIMLLTILRTLNENGYDAYAEVFGSSRTPNVGKSGDLDLLLRPYLVGNQVIGEGEFSSHRSQISALINEAVAGLLTGTNIASPFHQSLQNIIGSRAVELSRAQFDQLSIANAFDYFVSTYYEPWRNWLSTEAETGNVQAQTDLEALTTFVRDFEQHVKELKVLNFGREEEQQRSELREAAASVQTMQLEQSLGLLKVREEADRVALSLNKLIDTVITNKLNDLTVASVDGPELFLMTVRRLGDLPRLNAVVGRSKQTFVGVTITEPKLEARFKRWKQSLAPDLQHRIQIYDQKTELDGQFKEIFGGVDRIHNFIRIDLSEELIKGMTNQERASALSSAANHLAPYRVVAFDSEQKITLPGVQTSVIELTVEMLRDEISAIESVKQAA